MNIKLGIGYNPGDIKFIKKTLMGGDIVYRAGSLKDDIKIHTGIEGYIVRNRFCLRAGVGTGTHRYFDITAGAGYQLRNKPEIHFDYALVFPLSGAARGTYGNHPLALSSKGF